MIMKHNDTADSVPFILKDDKIGKSLGVKATVSVTFEGESGVIGRIETQAGHDIPVDKFNAIPKYDKSRILNDVADEALALVFKDFENPEKKRQIKRISGRIADELESGDVTIVHWRYKPTC